MPYIDSHPSLINLGAAAILSTFSVQVTAQSELSELDYLNDIEVTFAATRLPQQLKDAPASVTIIDRRIIEASSATNITELMRLVPGLQSYHIATNASAVSYHGISDKFPPRLEVMIDGRSVYLPLFSAVIWELLPISIDDIDRIEVVRGSNTVTQGSNAFMGAINIITHSALEPRDNIVKYSSGEFNSASVYGRYSSGTDYGYYSVSSGITGNEGNQFSNGSSDPYHQRYLNFNGTISPTLNDSITINLGINSGYSSVGDINNDPVPQRREFTTSFQNIEWHRQLNNQQDINIHYSHSLNNLTADLLSIPIARAAATDRVAQAIDTLLAPVSYVTDREALAQAFIDANPYRVTAEIGKLEQHIFELSSQWQPNHYNKFLTDFEYRDNKASNYQILNTHEWVSSSSTRASLHWENKTIPEWTFNLGASVEHGGNDSTRISPRVAANLHINESVTLRSSASRAFRMPSLLETNYTSTVYTPNFPLPVVANLQTVVGEVVDYIYKPNPDLKPEQIDTMDIGVLAYWPQYNSNLDVRAFYEEINNGITETNTPDDTLDYEKNGVHTYTNLSQWSNQGIEFQYKYQSLNGIKPLILLNYGYIDTNGYRILDPNRPWIDRLETRNPMHTASLLTSVTLPNQLQISLSHYFLSSVQWIEAHRNIDVDPPNSTYHRTDLKISKNVRVSETNDLKLSLIVQNLLDNPYSEFYAGNMFEQRTYVQAQLSF